MLACYFVAANLRQLSLSFFEAGAFWPMLVIAGFVSVWGILSYICLAVIFFLLVFCDTLKILLLIAAFLVQAFEVWRVIPLF